MTPEEQQNAMKLQPELYFTAIHEQGVQQIDQMVNNFLSNVATNTRAMYDIVIITSEELSIFRAMEVDLRAGKLADPEQVKHYLTRLSGFRQKIQAAQKAAVVQQQK